MSDPINDPIKAFESAWAKWFEPPTKLKLAKGANPELFYYKPGTRFNQNPDHVEILLQEKTGSCKAMVELLWVLGGKLSGAQCKRIKISPVQGYSHFLVKEWLDLRKPEWAWNNWRMRFGGQKPDMEDPKPPGDPLYFGLVKNDITGIPGQNCHLVTQGQNCPSQKVFVCHYVLRLELSPNTYKYYDPSYGTTYTGEDNFRQKALYALGKNARIDPRTNRMIMELDNTPPDPWVTFTIG